MDNTPNIPALTAYLSGNGFVPTITPKDLTSQMLQRMTETGLSRPIPLGEYDMKKPFIYQRGLGVMVCEVGCHRRAGALLFAFNAGMMNALDAEKEMRKLNPSMPKVTYEEDVCEFWIMNTHGTALVSSVSRRKALVGKRGNLNDFEKRILKESSWVRYLSE